MLRFLYVIILITCNVHLANATNGVTDAIRFPKAEVINEYTTRIPFKLVDHLIVIEAELFNKKGNFIIDTGSETLILNKVHFSILYEHQKKDQIASGILQSIDNLYEKQVKELALKNFKILNKESHVIDLSHIETNKKIQILGIIGYNILKDYELFIDLYLNQITLTKTDDTGNTLDKHVYLEKIIDSLDFKLKNHTIIVTATINDQKLLFGLDTAAEFNQINKSTNRKALKYFKPTKRLVLTGASNKKIEVLAGKLYRVKLSESIYFGPMNTVLTNLSKMNEAFGTDLDGILGYEFFAQKRTIINYKKKKLYFINYPLNFQ